MAAISELTINYLTQAQYDEAKTAGTLNEDQIYMTPSSDSGTDTSDATVTATDLASGVTAYGSDGTLITGTLPYEDRTFGLSAPSLYNTNYLALPYASSYEKRIIGGGKILRPYVALSTLGDAAATDVASGKTFTSSAGLLATGTLVEGSPALSNNTLSCSVTGTTIKNGASGGNTSYTNYTRPANRILYSTATINSDGSILLSNPLNTSGSDVDEQISNYSTYPYFYGDLGDGSNDSEVYKYSFVIKDAGTYLTNYRYSYYHQYVEKTINATGTNSEDVIVRSDTGINIPIVTTNFGSATTGDVAAGKTFTSISGLKLTGTGAQLLSVASGSVSTTGVTSIDTGLYKVERFIVFQTSISKTGITMAVVNNYTASTSTYYAYCSSYTSSSSYTIKFGSSSTLFSLDGGTVICNGTDTEVLNGGTWVAYGYKNS